MSGNTHVVGQMQGYLLQIRHMLCELITLDDITVSVECLDDVAAESADGTIIAEQIKSVTSSNNPISDRADVFWKTLSNWFEYVRDGSLPLDKTLFRMIVSSNHPITPGDLIKSFNDARNQAQAQAALQDARTKLWGAKNELKEDTAKKTYGKYLDAVFSSENESTVLSIIEKMSVIIYQSDYDEKLFDKFMTQTILPEFAEKLIENMLGWITNQANNYLKQGAPAVIRSADYRLALTKQMRMYYQQNSIPALTSEIDEATVRTELEQQDIYLRQLDLIESDYDTKLEAASDYLRTKAETVIRAEKGLVAPQSLDDYNDKMNRLWKSKRQQSLLLASYSDVDKGKQLYAQTSEAASTIPLQGTDVPSFFGCGALQVLANSPIDTPTIGWHPKYKELLQKGGTQNE